MIEVEGLRAGYGLINVLWDVSLSVPSGKTTVIVGPNGAGKTTLLKAIMGRIPISKGSVAIVGRRMVGTQVWRMAEKGVVLVPEGRLIFADMSVEENLLLGAFNPRARRRAAENLDRVHGLLPRLRERRFELAGSLSGGEAQMLAIGRALMAAPEVILIDEPSIGLAPIMVKQIFGVLDRLKETKLTVLVVEQNTKRAVSIADQVVLMRGGRIVLSAPSGSVSLDALHAEYLK